MFLLKALSLAITLLSYQQLLLAIPPGAPIHITAEDRELDSDTFQSLATSNPSSQSQPAPGAPADLAPENPNFSFFDKFLDETPEPIRENSGAKVIGPANVPIQKQNPDVLAPPTTDNGQVQNAKWPFDMSKMRLLEGGWVRVQNTDVMPIATDLCGVNMRLEKNAIRELHWHHLVSEWGFVTKGHVRITLVTPEGQNYEADTKAGDVWFMPGGYAHGLQATNETEDGAEFLLIFDNGGFSPLGTFQILDWLAHTPKEVIAKSLGLPISSLSQLPGKERNIFPGTTAPPKIKNDTPEVTSPQGKSPVDFYFPWSDVTPTPLPGGSVKFVDSTNFPASKGIAAAEVVVEEGGIRELHWHPTQSEWTYFLEGSARITLFAGNSDAATYNYEPGDVGYVPAGYGHYVENIGTGNLRFIEVLKADKFEDISLAQWMALTPPELVKAHLNIDDEDIALLKKKKQIVVL